MKGSCRFRVSRCRLSVRRTCYVFFCVQLFDGWFSRVVVIFDLNICLYLYRFWGVSSPNVVSCLGCGLSAYAVAKHRLLCQRGFFLGRTWGFFLLHYMFALYTCKCSLEKSVRYSGCWVLCMGNHMGDALRYHHNLMHVLFYRSNASILLSVP